MGSHEPSPHLQHHFNPYNDETEVKPVTTNTAAAAVQPK